jgi:hypothetical protein
MNYLEGETLVVRIIFLDIKSGLGDLTGIGYVDRALGS